MVVQLVYALCYKPEGRGFYSQWCQWDFFIDIILRHMAQGLNQLLT